MHIILIKYIIFYSQHFEYAMPDLAIDNNNANCVYHLNKQYLSLKMARIDRTETCDRK